MNMSSPAKLAEIQIIPLRDAYLCPQCESVGNCSAQCPCGNSLGLLYLSAVLNREPAAVIAQERWAGLLEAVEELESVCAAP